jgi:hypothetical protein
MPTFSCDISGQLGNGQRSESTVREHMRVYGDWPSWSGRYSGKAAQLRGIIPGTRSQVARPS